MKFKRILKFMTSLLQKRKRIYNTPEKIILNPTTKLEQFLKNKNMYYGTGFYFFFDEECKDYVKVKPNHNENLLNWFSEYEKLIKKPRNELWHVDCSCSFCCHFKLQALLGLI
ncbi:hypothetical protein A3Q56_02269 [Intoshia linei]|uniref:Uncharacterized protein n=1 Tax=Intoshia linei TaxID=1819745 RepID=A0A177B6M3_9BILA|nr:hypothetical protein A3Q56_02269 [Intoshia linei]